MLIAGAGPDEDLGVGWRSSPSRRRQQRKANARERRGEERRGEVFNFNFYLESKRRGKGDMAASVFFLGVHPVLECEDDSVGVWGYSAYRSCKLTY